MLICNVEFFYKKEIFLETHTVCFELRLSRSIDLGFQRVEAGSEEGEVPGEISQGK